MTVRRALYRWMWIATLVLPAWTILGWMVFSREGWQLAGVLISVPLLFVALIATGVVISLRPEVRTARALTPIDAALLVAWHLTIVLFGAFAIETWWAILLMIVVGLGVFWSSVWRLVAGVREQAAQFRAEYEQMRTPGPPKKPGPDWQGELIVVEDDRPSPRSL